MQFSLYQCFIYKYIRDKPQSQARREIRGSLLIRLREVTYTEHLGNNPKIPDQRAGRIAQNPQGVEAPCEKAVHPEEHWYILAHTQRTVFASNT